MINAKVVQDQVEIRFSYYQHDQFASIISRIKSIPGRKFHAGEGNSGYWSIPIKELSQLQQLFPSDLNLEETTETIAPKTLSMDLSFYNHLTLPLRAFQILGSNFLSDTGSCILADDLGVGKTCQILAAIYKMYRQGYVQKTLIVTPASLKYQWGLEIQKFFDIEKLNIQYRIIDGTMKQRTAIYDTFKSDDILFTIVNYELVRNDIEILKTMKFDIVVADEVHRIANWKSATNAAMKQLDGRIYWGATGTPVQNKPDEVFSIMEWIRPGFLGSLWQFRNKYMVIGEKFGQRNIVLGFRNLRDLHQRISPFMLRRLKKDVAPELPPLLINNYWVELTSHQKRIHDQIADDLSELIREVAKNTTRNDFGDIIQQDVRGNQILGLFTLLQESCTTLELLMMSDSQMAAHYLPASRPEEFGDCPKIDELVTILKDYFDAWTSDLPPKIVIFSQFERMQQILIRKLGAKKLHPDHNVPLFILNGTLSAKEKESQRTQFKAHPGPSIFLCTDSGNYGINLEEAALLVNIDVPWNPAKFDQRNNRIHRLSSTHESINVINLLSRESLDERIMNTIYSKTEVAKTIIESDDEERSYMIGLTRSLVQKLASGFKKK